MLLNQITTSKQVFDFTYFIGKCLKLYFESIWKVIDSFLIEDILECVFPIIIRNILL